MDFTWSVHLQFARATTILGIMYSVYGIMALRLMRKWKRCFHKLASVTVKSIPYMVLLWYVYVRSSTLTYRKGKKSHSCIFHTVITPLVTLRVYKIHQPDAAWIYFTIMDKAISIAHQRNKESWLNLDIVWWHPITRCGLWRCTWRLFPVIPWSESQLRSVCLVLKRNKKCQVYSSIHLLTFYSI